MKPLGLPLSLLAAALFAPLARAQTPCQANPGPDLVVTNASQIFNFNSINGVEALGVRAEITNVGQHAALYQANSSAHPLYGQTLYRHRVVDGAPRFEQIGTSWLKHGFFALSQGGACTCQPTNGTTLGIGCTESIDVSGASGSTSSFGPRWQVNALTGAFPYPPASPPLPNFNSRRLQVDIADLEPTGAPGAARYFVALTTLAADETAAGNQQQNGSLRELGVSGSGSAWTFTFVAQLAREVWPLEAWAALDPGVQIATVAVPGEGRFQLGALVTDLGGGRWRYEYALHNRNCDASAGSFGVPLGAGASALAPGFHDLTYRDGDGIGGVSQDGTDWAPALAGGVLTWSSAPFAQNPNANALRWDSTYNFRFDADAPPVPGSVTIGLFKPHAPGSVSVAAPVPGPAGPAAILRCFGDGSGSACPCGNHSAPGAAAGCLNSLGQGATLRVSGNPALSFDTLRLAGASMPDASVLYFEGTAPVAGGQGAIFGDGLRCAAGTLTRLGTHVNSGGASVHPAQGGTPISIATGAPAGATRHYQGWYRNAAAFCTADTFNLTNAAAVTWGP